MFICTCGYKTSVMSISCAFCGRSIVKSRTQKGCGIQALQSVYHNTLYLLAIMQTQEHVDMLATSPLIKFPLFARPAPSVPRHGYIDSRIVNTPKEVCDLLSTVLKDDPLGELLLCKYISSSHNAIWTPGSITIGRGHDGATGGKDVIVVPLAGKNTIPLTTLKQAGIKPDSWPYVEVVYKKNEDPLSATLTQLREGPIMKSVQGNFIPSPTLIKHIVHADPSKFKDTGWEKEIQKFSGMEGVIVWHPNGSITDHFSIHAFTEKIPIIFDEKSPLVGDILEPTIGAAQIGFNPESMLRGFVAGSKLLLEWNSSNLLEAALVILHNATAMTGESSKWLGFGTAILLRFGMAALNGEARHFRTGLEKSGKQTREAVYVESLHKTMNFHKARVNRLVNIFRYGRWASAGFGGPKWACCGAATIDVFNSIWALANNPTEDTAAAVVQAVNLMVNQAHNGGWWFNKFIGADVFERAASSDLAFIIRTGPTFYEEGKRIEKFPTALAASMIASIAKWGRITLSPPKASGAKVLYHPNINALEISISAKLLGEKFKTLKAAITKLSVTDMKLLKNSLYLVEGDDGYRLELRKNSPIVIWQDDSLHEKSVEAAKHVFKNK